MDDSATSVPSSIWASLNSWFTSTVFFVLLNVMIATIVFTSNLPNSNQQNHRLEGEDEEQKQNSQNHLHNHSDRNQPQIARSHSILHRLKSFNFLPDRSQQVYSPENDHHQEPLQVAATQYVFNQPLEYQHFDYDFDSTGSDHIPAAAAQFSALNQTQEAPLLYTETHVVWEHQQPVETGTTHFDMDPTREEILSDTGFEDAHEEQEQTDEFQSLDEVYSKLKSRHDRTKSDGDLPPKLPTKMKKSASLKVGFAHLEEEEIVEARRPETVRERKSVARVMEDDDVEVDSKADDFINKFKNDLMLQRIESIMKTKDATGRGTAK